MRSLIPLTEELTPPQLTVVAQTISPNDQGRLKWDVFFPRDNVDSIDLHEVSTTDFRPTSDRREWDSRGRLIHTVTPNLRDLEIVPVEGYYKWGEREIQKLAQRADGNSELLSQIIGRSVPSKVAQITEANYRRIEVDAFSAWATGTVTGRNPQTGESYTISFNFPSERMTTAGTAWDDPGQNAWNNLISFVEDATDLIGPVQGVVLRTSLLRVIQADAPDLTGGVAITRAQLADRVSQELGTPFRFFLFDDTLDIYNDGGISITRTNVWPAGRIAAVPQGGRVGRTAFAPVVRAMEIIRESGNPGIDQRGMTVYYSEEVMGRDLTVEVQCNPFTIPNEQLVRVENTLVS